jgi:hypothetical protein
MPIARNVVTGADLAPARATSKQWFPEIDNPVAR